MSVFDRVSGGNRKRSAGPIAATLAMLPGLSACLQAGDTAASPPANPMVVSVSAVSPKPYIAPRFLTTDKPDLNGVWQVLNTANYNIEAHPASAAIQLRPGPYVPVPAAEIVALGAVGAVPAGVGIVQGDGKIPYTAEALKRRDENKADYLNSDPEVKCYLPGIPRANYMDKPFQIFQSDNAIFFAYEYAAAVRNIYLEDPGEAPVPSWMGQSFGKWDGDTLVIEVTGLNGDTWFDRAGNHHSASIKVTERWTPTSDNTMRYEATIEDEETFTRPWRIAFNLYKKVGEDAKLQQFRCVEFVEELMLGHLRKNPLPGPALERAKREAQERASQR